MRIRQLWMLRLAVVSLLSLSVENSSAQAGWDHVFQAACWNCRPRESRFFAPAPPPPSVRPSVSTSRYETRYEEREMEETITVMKPEYTKEPVDVQVRSYYWDPVTTYTTRSYRNPATGCTETISEPRVSYVRKEECTTVTKYVERMRMVPVQETRRYIERTPVTTIYGPTTRYYPKDCDSCGLPSSNRPSVQPIPGNQPRVIEEGRLGPQEVPTQSLRRNSPSTPSTTPTAPQRKPNVPVNSRTTSATKVNTSHVRGELMNTRSKAPVAETKLVFLNANDFSDRRVAVSDRYGNFTADLPAGRWIVYVATSEDSASKTETIISLGEYDTKTVAVAVR